ncbi:hypothetical protein V1519DRAFT_427940 [Lipomyces tetrasporus]
MAEPHHSHPSSLTTTLSSDKSDPLVGLESGEKSFPDAVTVPNGRFGWGKEALPTLRNICCKSPASSFTAVIGPVESGKTTFLRAVLNELPEIEDGLAIYGSTFAFCDHSPWLIDSTVQKNIIREALLDREWYGVEGLRARCRFGITSIRRSDGGGQQGDDTWPRAEAAISNCKIGICEGRYHPH